MKILVACEESQTICIELRKIGHEAYSCDIETCSGGHPEWHIMQDVLPLLNGNCTFEACDGAVHTIVGRWDMIIAFPPCTHLAVSGARYFEQKRQDGRQQQGIDFFMRFANCNCERVAIENPVGIMSTYYRKPDQIIQPYEYGDSARKKTCLWLKGLPLLEPTNVLPEPESGHWNNQTPSGQNKLGPSPDRAKIRSKTYQGIAQAMAEQWSEYLERGD